MATKELREVIRQALDVPRVVGAGIGARPRCGADDGSCEPVLTVMVEKKGPGDRAVASALGHKSGRPVEVIEVGKVSALLLDRSEK